MPFENTLIPPGLCQCGCGGETKLPRSSWAKFGWVAGQPLRYIHGHNIVGPLRYTIDEITGCWLWGGALTGDEYGYIRRNRLNFPAHRWFYEQRHGVGSIPEGMHLDHLCRVHRCVNPDHLEPVTPTENLRRGRSTKLTAAQVREIRALKGTAPAWKIAERFSVTSGQINNVWYRKSWSDLPD